MIGQLEEFLRAEFIHVDDTSMEILRIDDVDTAWRPTADLQTRTAIRFKTEVKLILTIPADSSRTRNEYKSESTRQITVDGWARYVDDEYREVEFESAFFSR